MRRFKLGLLLAASSLSLLAYYGDAAAHGDEVHSQDQPKAAATGTSVAAHLDAPQRLPDGSLFIPKALQRQLGLRTQLSHVETLAAAVELNGKVIADPDSGGRVQAVFAGSVLPGAKGMPVLGRKVIKGEILAYLRPISSAIERGNQQALQADLEAQLSIAAHKLVRYQQLEGVLPQKDIEAARIERDALQQRRAFVSASIHAQEPLLAPASGIISASYVVAGQVVDAKEMLFEIVDPARLAVEALAYDSSIATTLSSASALVERSEGALPLALKFIGGGQQLREQALPLLFRIVPSGTANATVAVGQPLKVIVHSAKGIKGVAVARSALSKNTAGETVLWLHTDAERFVLRRVSQQALDAHNIAVTDGLHEGERVVTLAASLLSEVR